MDQLANIELTDIALSTGLLNAKRQLKYTSLSREAF